MEEWTEKYKKKGLEFKDLLAVYSTCEKTVHRHSEEEVSKKNLLIMELDLHSLFGLLCTAVLIG